MKRLHVHVTVPELVPAVAFYSRLFASEPTVLESDYAKWMLDDPHVNFAISARGGAPGLDHLGVQVEEDAELEELRGRIAAAEAPLAEERDVACCYARSDKYWTLDPAGIRWEGFRSFDRLAHYDEPAPANSACGTTCCASQSGSALVCCAAASSSPPA